MATLWNAYGFNRAPMNGIQSNPFTTFSNLNSQFRIISIHFLLNTHPHVYIQMYVSSFVCKSDTNTYTCMHGMFSPSAPKRRPNVLSFVPSCGTITQIFSFVEADLHKKSAINVDDAITMEHIFKPHITPEPIFKTNRTVIGCKCLKLFYWITKISDRTKHWKIEYSIWTMWAMCECTWSTNK